MKSILTFCSAENHNYEGTNYFDVCEMHSHTICFLKMLRSFVSLSNMNFNLSKKTLLIRVRNQRLSSEINELNLSIFPLLFLVPIQQ